MEAEKDKIATPDNEALHALEKLGTGIDSARGWVSRAWKIGVILAKGAYLSGERKRLLLRLGEIFYAEKNTVAAPTSGTASVISQLDRISKKLEIQDIQIRTLRFGKRTTLDNDPPPTKGATSHV